MLILHSQPGKEILIGPRRQQVPVQYDDYSAIVKPESGHRNAVKPCTSKVFS